MHEPDNSRASRKRRTIMDAALRLFLSRGYDGTSMEEVAVAAAVSKPTVYKHFADKEQLFREIILSTTDQAVALVEMVTETFANSQNVEQSLRELAHRFIDNLMQPDLLRLRRLVIATAERFPDVGRIWYESGFDRALDALAGSFEVLSAQGALNVEDPLLAANHFVGLLLWIPVNRAMFTGANRYTQTQINGFAESAVVAFLLAYGAAPPLASRSVAHRGPRQDGARAPRG